MYPEGLIYCSLHSSIPYHTLQVCPTLIHAAFTLSPLSSTLLCSFLACVFTYELSGNVAIVVCLLSLMPFMVFCVCGSFQVDPSRWLEAPPGGLSGVDWRLLLNTFFWNINFWER